jgi:excisionase family DNA binding protein
MAPTGEKKPVATEIMSASEAARILGIGLNYLYTLMRVGKLAATRVDGKWQIKAEAVRQRLVELEKTRDE